MLQIAFLEPDRRPDADITQRCLEKIAHACIGAEPIGHDRNEPATGLQASQGRLEMADGGMTVGAETHGARERRVHQDDAGARRVCERGIDRRPVMAGNHRIGKRMSQARAARRGIFVELEAGMIPAMGDEKSITGTRLQNDISGLDSRQDDSKRGEINGCRKLLPFDLLLAAHRLGGQPVEQVAGRTDIGE